MTEEQLQGGFVNLVVRIGDTVRRQPGERAGFVHELLHHLEAQEWLGAPRFLGIDDDGEFHDLTAGTPLAGDQEVVCHNDLSPKNTVYAGRVAQACRTRAAHPRPGLLLAVHRGRPPNLPLAIDRWRAICEGYGLTDRSALVATALWWQDRTWRGIEAAAAAGELGVPADIRQDHDWVTANADVLESAVQ